MFYTLFKYGPSVCNKGLYYLPYERFRVDKSDNFKLELNPLINSIHIRNMFYIGNFIMICN